MNAAMTTILCPVCGRRLMSTRIYRTVPHVYTIADDEHPKDLDTKLKCPRCKAIVGIEK